MITKKILENEIENLIGLNDMVRAYEEIAASRIRHTRDSVLRSRTYVSEINEIFEQVISSYRNQVEALMKAKKIKNRDKFSFINRNGKTLYLLISANTGLYGSIIKRTFDLFINTPKNNPYDIAIIGKLGLSMWEKVQMKEKYFYFDFPDQRVSDEILKEILNLLITYEKVVVFHGQFLNLIKQDATFSDISGNSLSKNSEQRKPMRYFFEPSLEKILEFFEKQIFSSIFEQTVRESQLAKIASRLTTLDEASENIDKKLIRVTSQNNRFTHSQQNRKQLETFSSRILWGGI